MASVFGHGILAYTIKKTFEYKPHRLLVILAIVSSILPDLDVIGFRFGIRYEEPLGHRGFTHSILFALLWTAFVTMSFGRKQKLLFSSTIFLATISHSILDAMTNGGRGVGFFIPFDNTRYFFPFREILVSPLGIENFFSKWGLAVLWSEMRYILIPCAIILIIIFLKKRIENK